MAQAGYAKIEAFLKKADPNKARDYPYTFKFVITQDGGARACVIDGKNLKVTKGDGAADVTFVGGEDVVADLLAQKTNVKDALTAGRITIEGDREIAKIIEPFIAKVHLL